MSKTNPETYVSPRMPVSEVIRNMYALRIEKYKGPDPNFGAVINYRRSTVRITQSGRISIHNLSEFVPWD